MNPTIKKEVIKWTIDNGGHCIIHSCQLMMRLQKSLLSCIIVNGKLISMVSFGGINE